MNIRETSIDGVYFVETTRSEDTRGSFYRAYCDTDLRSVLQRRKIIQINVSRTDVVGAIRGIHFQHPPRAEMKLVRCLAGAVWDVVVDLRKGSDTFLRWEAVKLDDRQATMLVIPEGCAHGFQVMDAHSQLLYVHTAKYAPDYEGGIRYDDPRLAIAWPLPVTEISDRDLALPSIDAGFEGLTL